MNKIFVFGHKKPDTDSVCSAIGLSYLKNKLGYDTVPMVLGEINNETKFVLNYFNVEVPNYLNDVKLQIRDLDYLKNVFVDKHMSIFSTYNYMNEQKISNVPVVDKNNKFLGTTSMKDIATDAITSDDETLNTSYDNIVNVLNGKALLKFNEDIKGNLLVASFKNSTFLETVKLDRDTILIVGDRHRIIEYAINSGVKLIILTGSSRIKDEHIEMAKQNRVNIIKTDYFSFKVARLIRLSNYINTILNNDNIVYFDETEDVKDFIDIATKTRHSYFPVVNKAGDCLGTIKLADSSNKHKKQVILVDHNEFEQSVDGLDEADILEIIDHHKLGTIGTSLPINFRNMPVGSTCTIIYMLYRENNVPIPKTIAGILLSGIISDTLLLVSPTTTDRDRKVCEELSEIAEIDAKKYAMEMFKAGSVLKGKNHEEILYTDFKNFTINNKKVGVSQISTVNTDEFENASKDYIELIEKIAKNNDYYILILLVTDILNNGSYIYYNQASEDILNNCFNVEQLNQGTYLEGVISRKKQVIPNIMEVLNKK